MFGRIIHAIVRSLDWLAGKTLPPENIPPHQLTGRRGEEAAYFYLRRLGIYHGRAQFRSPHRRGEIDLIAWDKDVLCFVEVKTRTSHDVKPAEAAVDQDKQRELRFMAREYLGHLPPLCQWRFDIVSVYYEQPTNPPRFELFRNAIPLS
jgi:putative endonuclease